MSDLKIDLFEDGSDLVLVAGDLQRTAGLTEAVLVSLFSDRRAAIDEVPAGEDLRGWCLEEPGDRFGSALWLLARGKVDDNTATRIRDYCTEALDWLRIEDIADEVTVTAEVNGERVDFAIEIRRGNARAWAEKWADLANGVTAEKSIGDSRLRLIYR